MAERTSARLDVKYRHLLQRILLVVVSIPFFLGACAPKTEVASIETTDVLRTLSGKLATPIPSRILNWSFDKVELSQEEYAIKSISSIVAGEAWGCGSQSTGDDSGPRGLLVHYDGQEWSIIQETVAPMLTTVQALAANGVWLAGGCGSEALVIHFDGQNWIRDRLPGLADRECLLDIDLAGVDTGCVVGTGGVVFHYDHGSWLRSTIPLEYVNLVSVDMVSREEGWALGQPVSNQDESQAHQPILHYENGTWHLEPIATEHHLNALHFLSVSEGWSVGDAGTVLRYQGEGWEPVESDVKQDLQSIQALASDDVWIGGQGIVLHYQDGEWSKIEAPWNWPMTAIAMTAASEGWLGFDDELYRLTPYLSFVMPTPTPDLGGARIAYIGPDGGIWLIDAAGSSKDQVFDGRGFDIRDIAWLPGGARISFASFYNGAGLNDWFDILTVDIDGAAVHDTGLDSSRAEHSWSPTGERVVCTNGEGLVVHDLALGTELQITNEPEDREPAWSPQQDLIAFSRQGDIYVIQADGSGLRLIGGCSFEDCSSPAWSPHGLGIAVTKNDSAIVVLDPDPFLTMWRDRSMGNGSTPSWSPTGRIVCELQGKLVLAGFEDQDSIAEGHSPVWQPIQPRP